jgi:DNA polymerase (family 10)
VADLLEIGGANEFRVRAYRKAARTIGGYPRSMANLLDEGQDLTELSGIGNDLAGKIEEIVKTGGLRQLKEIEQRTPSGLAQMLKVEGLGPKRVQQLYKELEITDLDQLEEAASQAQIRLLDGFGPKTEENILRELSRKDLKEERTRLNVAEEMARPLVAYLKDIEGVERVEVAGSYRRRKETVGDLDVLAISRTGEETIQRFVEYEDVDEIVSQGETRSTVVFRSGLQVDLRVVPKESYGAALFYFTGSKDHNIALRNLALDQDLKVNEYGVFHDEERIAGETEDEIYELFDLPYIPPELREDRGELAAAREGRLPALVTLEDIRGDLQMHTTGSDGDASLEEMAGAALERGCFLEINAHPERLDLDDVHAKMAKDMGLKLAINTDAHSVAELNLMRFGMGQARRGWLEADDVLNTRPWPDLKELRDR